MSSFNLHIHGIFTKSAVHDDISIYTFAQDVTASPYKIASVLNFNPHIRTEDNKLNNPDIFQSTHSHKIWPKFFMTASKPFQSTYPHKMQFNWKNKIALSSVFQSTHPCRMQLQHIKIDTALVQISIHTSVQNATRIFQDFLLIIRISIHASV